MKRQIYDRRVTFRMSETQRRELQRAATEERRDISELVRLVTADWLASRRRHGEAAA